jgi:Sigma-70 region 2
MVTDQPLARAQAGDGEAFRELIEPHRRELHVHCYRMLGSVQDAEDLLQEALLAAWRGLDAYTPIAHAHGLLVITIADEGISGVTRFLDNSLLAYFGLPRTLRNDPSASERS